MLIDILSQPNIATGISIFTMLCFAAAFLLAYKNWRSNSSVFIVSSVLFVNFVIANNALFNLLTNSSTPDQNFYLRWIQYDAISIVAIIAIHLILRVKNSTTAKAAMWLLLSNSIYYAAMHIDIILLGNREPWLLWTLYTPVVHLVEVAIAATLIYSTVTNHFHNQPAK